jgi:hypothetical protein
VTLVTPGVAVRRLGARAAAKRARGGAEPRSAFCFDEFPFAVSLRVSVPPMLPAPMMPISAVHQPLLWRWPIAAPQSGQGPRFIIAQCIALSRHLLQVCAYDRGAIDEILILRDDGRGPRRLAAPDERPVSALRADEHARKQCGGGTDVATVRAFDSGEHFWSLAFCYGQPHCASTRPA